MAKCNDVTMKNYTGNVSNRLSLSPSPLFYLLLLPFPDKIIRSGVSSPVVVLLRCSVIPQEWNDGGAIRFDDEDNSIRDHAG